jgi:hypothetical protein
MTFAIFTRSEMVVTPGWTQILNTIAMLIGTCGVAFAMFGRFTLNVWTDVVLRLLLAAVSGVVLFHPNDTIALSICPLVLAGVIVGIFRHRVISPAATLAVEEKPLGKSDQNLAELAHEAKHEF